MALLVLELEELKGIRYAPAVAEKCNGALHWRLEKEAMPIAYSLI